jgi:DNA-binding Xre family transcriptional regulator
MKNRLKLDTDNLKSLIAQRRLRKTELALDIGVTRETFSRWLAGRVEYIDENKLMKLSERLDCEPSLLSPEIAPGRRLNSALPPAESVGGDDFIRMGLYSGLWRELALLHDNARNQDVVQDGKVNQNLCRALHAFFSVDGAEFELWSSEPDPLQKNHEYFDVMARQDLTLAVARMLQGDLAEAHRLCKLVSIQANREWLASAAYLLAGMCQVLLGKRKEALETWTRGLMSFPESQEDLTLFMQANLRLAVSMLSVQGNGELAWAHFLEARKVFNSLGYRYGHARCLASEALLLARLGKHEEAQNRVQELMSLVHRLPRLHRIEVLLCMAGVSSLAQDTNAARDQLEMAQTLAASSDVLSFVVKKQLEGIVHTRQESKDDVLSRKAQ